MASLKSYGPSANHEYKRLHRIEYGPQQIMTVKATPTQNSLALHTDLFDNLTSALDYAAQGETGANFYGSRAQLIESISYQRLATESKQLAQKLIALDFVAGDRVVIIAETNANFMRGFFACQYAGLIPIPVPVPIQLGSRAAYVRKTRDLLISAHATAVFTPESVLPMVNEACQDIDMKFVGDIQQFHDQSFDDSIELHHANPEDTAYIQFTSGSTRFPRGVVIEQKAVMSNLQRIINDGIKIRRSDRLMSWLPFYHDMGLVGQMLAPVASQTSVDYLDTRDFAMRPRRWLEIMSQNKSTISFSPPFGYELVERRLREAVCKDYDLSNWRVAGIGAETIRPEPMLRFAKILANCGFDAKAFLPCYGMAECTLAVSFADIDKPLNIITVDGDKLAEENLVVMADSAESTRIAQFIDCGKALPEHTMEIRDHEGNALADSSIGVIHVSGPSVMSHYFDNTEETARTLQNGWLNTGDIGFMIDGSVFITGREKDLIIVNGRNIWPQDIEAIAEQQPEIRTGDALAFSAPNFDGDTTVVVVVQCRNRDEENRKDLIERIETAVINGVGVRCFVKLVAPHTLPRTSSGKLSRSAARRDYMEQNGISEGYLAETDHSSTAKSAI